MHECNVSLVNSRITKISVDFNMTDEGFSQLQTTQKSTVHEPLDHTDPTVLVKSECSMQDPSGKQFLIRCSIESIFKFDPVPEDRTSVASEKCPDFIHEEFRKRVNAILHDMGHDIILNK